jgi:hypothetical protein
MFAKRYIENNIVYPPFIDEGIRPEVSMIVMIPCLNELEIIRTLESLWACKPIQSFCEVIVVVNNSENCSSEVRQFNQETFLKLVNWKCQNDRPNLVLHPIYSDSVPAKHAGAGMARKIGMDEAIRRFNAINKPDGVIVSTDSDCLFSPNYLERIESAFQSRSCFAATLNFKHRIDEMNDPKQKLGIQLYEDYLHYYKKAHDFVGYPDSIYTIGSAFAVRADAYVKQGGMNRRQAGEDFYFLYKLTKLGRVTEIEDAFVYPSARVSDRVPFGTGASMTKWMKNSEDLTLTYNFDAFLDLKALFDQVDKFFRIESDNFLQLVAGLPLSIQDYIMTIDFIDKLAEINKNSSSLSSFRKRFFQFFDAFIILRFLNFAHEKYYLRQNLSEAILQLQEYSEMKKGHRK